jgi:hypothetical protein
VTVIEFIVRSEMPVFLIFTTLGVEILPTCTEPKLTDCGAAEILGGAAFPKSFTFTVGFLGSLDAITIIAFLLPVDAGLNATEIAHELPFVIIEQSFS